MVLSDTEIIFRQLFEKTSSTYTYLIACARTRDAVLIDPVIDTIERDLKLIRELKLNLKYAVNTHCHADHVTGSGMMKKQLPELKSVISTKSGARADILIDEGDSLEFGDLKLDFLATPGHTNGCVSIVFHSGKSVFTGDTMLIRGCGRTDFQQGDSATLYDMVHTKLFTLPDDYKVFPAHDYTGQTCSTIGEEKSLNPRLTKTKQEFINIMKNLKLSYPAQIDKAVPANLLCGLQE